MLPVLSVVSIVLFVGLMLVTVVSIFRFSFII